MSTTFLDQMLSSFERNSQRPAIVHLGRSYSYADLHLHARRLAVRLQQLGLAPGERVVLPLAEKLPGLIAQLGVLLAGGLAVPLNPRLPLAEVPYYLTDSGASLAIVDPCQVSIFEELRQHSHSLRHVVIATLEEERSDAGYRQPQAKEDDPCLMIYSSGTTGWPKGVVHCQGNLLRALEALGDCWRYTPEDRTLHVLPLFHVHGLCFAAQLPLLTGGTILLEEGFTPAGAMDGLQRATVFMAVPTIWYRLLEEPRFRAARGRTSSLRLATCGSAPIRPEVLPDLEAILGQSIINRYGMSEAHVITSLPLGGPWPGGSVGIPVAGIEVEVRREDGSPAGPDEAGAVWIRGANLFREYWNKPEATRNSFRQGWFETGDLGFRNAGGFLTLVGRKNDLIISSGFNVYPAAVERVLNECPGVRESAVVGQEDAREGESVAAFIVRGDDRLDEAAVRAFCQDRLTGYQKPKTIVFVKELPRNSMGKVLRRELRRSP